MKAAITKIFTIIYLLSPTVTVKAQSKLAKSKLAQRSLAKTLLDDKRLDTVYDQATLLLGKGFNAGDGYPQVWIRDFNTFIEISCKVYSRDSVRKNLLTFLRLQQPNGEIVDGYVLKGHVTWNDPNIYTSENDTTHVGFKNTVETDQETSLIQAFSKYIHITGDRSVLSELIAGKTARQRLELSIAYLLKNRYSEKYQLLTGATTQDWGDVQIEGGAVVDVDSNTHWAIDIYDNAMFVIALKNMAGFYEGPASSGGHSSGEDRASRQRWLSLESLTAKKIRQTLWDAKKHKFIPHVYTASSPFPASFDENQICYHGGTAVAIEAGLLSREEIKWVNQNMVSDVRLSGAPSIGMTLYPVYPEGIYKNSTASKPYIYQNGGDWAWFGARMIRQLTENGYVEEAYAELQPMITRTLRDKHFYEWYSRDNQPNGSSDFKGSAGELALAIEALKTWAKNQ